MLRRIKPPKLVVCDDGRGLIKAIRRLWPETLIQRCLIHVHRNIKKATTKYPKTECASELLSLANTLIKVPKSREAALLWEQDFVLWAYKWKDYPAKDDKDSEKVWSRKRQLCQAREELEELIKSG